VTAIAGAFDTLAEREDFYRQLAVAIVAAVLLFAAIKVFGIKVK